LREEYDRIRPFVENEQELLRKAGAGAVIAVYSSSRSYLLEVDAYGLVTASVRERGGFVAIGSEKVYADYAATSFARMRRGSLSLHQAKMLAFRILQDAIETSGPRAAMSRPVQMATVVRMPQGPVASLVGRDEPETRDAVDNWIEIEAIRFKEHAPPPDRE